MLVFSRKKLESFTVDGPARVVISSISGDRVRIAVDAPLTTRVLRCELEPKPKEDGDVSDHRT